MAGKPVVKVEAVAKLGVEKLAALVAGEAERSPSFRKLVKAALAGVKGPEAGAKLVDTKLTALERAKGTIGWRRARTFRQDLDTLRAMIVDQLAPLSPAMGTDRLLRFLASNAGVYERVSDGNGQIAGVYDQALDDLPLLIGRLTEDDQGRLPARIMAHMAEDPHGYLLPIVKAVAPQLPAAALREWDALLTPKGPAAAGENRNRQTAWLADRMLLIRQMLARARGDLDALVALEALKSPASQDGLTMAQLLFDAGRFAEALDWLRRPREPGIRFVRREELADMTSAGSESDSIVRAQLEARILTALGDKAAAQSLRWARFEAELNPAILRDYIAALGDFEEFEALDKAFAHALASKMPEQALAFLVGWPRLDKAAALVLATGRRWDGRQFDVLLPAAEALSEEQPLAAAVLYRALLDDILGKSRSQAYGHATSFLAVLAFLDQALDPEAYASAGLLPHGEYEARLRQVHGRKYAFWSLVSSGL